MAFTNTHDKAQIEQALAQSLSNNLPEVEQVAISDIELPQASGLSAETIMFVARWTQAGKNVEKRLVARIQPQGEGLFMDYDLALEFKVIDALKETNVPVPEALFVELADNKLGAPFLVMERVDGRIAPDDPPFTVEGWVLELDENDQARLANNALETLAALHALDIEALGIADIGHGKPELSGLDRLIEYWSRFAGWAADGPNPTLDNALAWVKENRPANAGPDVLSWGDARLGNMIIGDDLSVQAVIDWEMVSIGPREMDLGWWLFLLEHHSSGVGVPLPAGFLDLEAEVSRYEELSGHAVSNLHYFKVLAGVRMCALVSRAATLMKAAGYIPEDSPMARVNPATIILAKLLDLPEPSGDSDYYIGQRA